MSAPRVVTIDGAAGSGKSTLARGLSRSLHLPYVNTGLMYRALTLVSCERGVDPDDGDAVADILTSLSFGFDEGVPPELLIEGSAPRAELTGSLVEMHVSQVARHPGVRALMQATQRRLGQERGAVMEGRDIGSVVFSDAPVKLYLEADPEARAERRALERADAPGAASAMHDRDRRDMRVNPFRPAVGAVVIDTTTLNIAEALEEALIIVRRLAPQMLTEPLP